MVCFHQHFYTVHVTYKFYKFSIPGFELHCTLMYCC